VKRSVMNTPLNSSVLAGEVKGTVASGGEETCLGGA
jgi:hypothetical protein